MRRLFLTVAAAFGFALSPLALANDGEAEHDEVEVCDSCAALLDLAVAHPSRKDDRARDAYRHPAQTIGFFRIHPTMKVGEYAPGGGWYSRLLGVYLGGQGKLTGLFASTATAKGDEAAKQRTRDAAARFGPELATATGQPAAHFGGYTLDAAPAAEKGSFDRILLMRMAHNMNRSGVLAGELQAMRDLLKPGGMLGVEQHRARADAPDAYVDGSKGYMREKDVIALIEAQGFELIGKSEVNANPKDRKDYESGATDATRPGLQAIGESDRMTLLFRKRA